MSGVVGRYAPSPTGALHLGNLRTALASFLSARARGGTFLLRIEDLDTPRCRPEFEARQLADLEILGINWDEAPLRQSDRAAVYTAQLNTLEERRLVYPCFCSRRDIASALSAPHGPSGSAYPGTCARIPRHESQARIADGAQHCWRIRVNSAPKAFLDGFAGEVAMDLEVEGGDFVVRRADGLFAYQLACAVDDALSGVTEVVRGADLLDSGARQAHVLACLGLPVPRYAHIPLMMGPDGARLSKRAGSDDISAYIQQGFDAVAIRSYLAHTLGLCDPGERPAMDKLITSWNPRNIPREDSVVNAETMGAFRA